MANRKKSLPRKANPLPCYFIVEGCTEENYIQCLKNIFNKIDENEVNLKKKLAELKNIDICISDPCVEHWLLAHFQKINFAENQECKYYENRLEQYINRHSARWFLIAELFYK